MRYLIPLLILTACDGALRVSDDTQGTLVPTDDNRPDPVDDTDTDVPDPLDGLSLDGVYVVNDALGATHYITFDGFEWRAATQDADGAWCGRSGSYSWGSYTEADAHPGWWANLTASTGSATRLEVLDVGYRMFPSVGTCPTMSDAIVTGHVCHGCTPSVGWDVAPCGGPLVSECF